MSFVDEGTDQVLDLLRERGAVNTIFLTTFTYGRSRTGRQIPRQPFPDHGAQVFRADVPGMREIAEVDLQGRRAGTLCLCHPDVRAFWTGLATDLCASYTIDGTLL